MSDTKKPESLLVMPVSGKYCEVIYNDQAYKIWKVHPGTPTKYGTKLPYDAAVYFLGKVPPIITLVPEKKDGKYVSPILPEDQAKIKESQARGFVGSFKNYNENQKALTASGGGDSSEALTKTLKALESQVAKNSALETKLSQLTDRLAKLEASSVPATQVSGGGTTQ